MIPRLRGMLTSVHALLHLRALRRVASAKLPTDYGEFDLHVFKSAFSTNAHVALAIGAIGDGESVRTRVHSSCLTGDLFHSARCDCGQQGKLAGVVGKGLSASERIPIEISLTASTSRYLKTKEEKLGRLLSSV